MECALSCLDRSDIGQVYVMSDNGEAHLCGGNDHLERFQSWLNGDWDMLYWYAMAMRGILRLFYWSVPDNPRDKYFNEWLVVVWRS